MTSLTFPYDYKAAGALLADDATKATVLHVILLSAYGSDAIYGNAEEDIPAADPITLWSMLEEDFSVHISEAAENKLNALMLAVATDGFYDEPTVFYGVCNALLEGDLGDVVGDAFDDVTVPELLWAVFEVGLHRDDNLDFSKSVAAAVKDIIEGEAEDYGEADTAEEVAPYFETFMQQEKAELMDQLRRLGVGEDLIGNIHNYG